MRLVWVLDVNDIERAATFWCAALGYRRGGAKPPYESLIDPRGTWPELLLQRVPEAKTGKNRMHLDIVVTDGPAETTRLLDLDARRVAEPFVEDGYWVQVLADPEGNELCVIQQPV